MIIYLSLAATLLLSACGGKDTGKYRLLTPPEMVRVLTDIQLAEATLQLHPHQSDSMLIQGSRYYAFIYQRYGIDDSSFRYSFRYYSARPPELEQIYQGVVDELSARQTELKKQRNLPSGKPAAAPHDSLRRTPGLPRAFGSAVPNR